MSLGQNMMPSITGQTSEQNYKRFFTNIFEILIKKPDSLFSECEWFAN